MAMARAEASRGRSAERTFMQDRGITVPPWENSPWVDTIEMPPADVHGCEHVYTVAFSPWQHARIARLAERRGESVEKWIAKAICQHYRWLTLRGEASAKKSRRQR